MGSDTVYQQQATELGHLMAENQIRLIYGGAKIGLMGMVANGALENNGLVTGVLPHFLRTKEIAHDSLTDLILVETMHERKTKMNELSEGVIALAGGFGTMEEFFEMLTWGQLGLHTKPMGLLNTNGFFDELITLLDKMVNTGFLKQLNREMVLIANEPSELLEKMKAYQAPIVRKWISEEET